MAKSITPTECIALINLPPGIKKGDVFEATELSPFYVNRLLRKNRIGLVPEPDFRILPIDMKTKKTKTKTAPKKRGSSTAVDEQP